MPERETPPDSPNSTDPLRRLPHTGQARLPGRVLSLKPAGRVTAERALAAGDGCLNEAGRFPSVLLVELMAQVCGLLIDDSASAPGDYAVLAGIKRMHLHGTARAGETVEVSGELSRRLGDLYLVDCRARAASRELAHGSLQIRRVRGRQP